jgi:calmodulin
MSSPSEAEIKEVFDQFDADGNGSIDSSEIKKVCEALGVEVSQAEVDALIHEADDNGDGKIQFSEFKKAVLGE